MSHVSRGSNCPKGISAGPHPHRYVILHRYILGPIPRTDLLHAFGRFSRIIQLPPGQPHGMSLLHVTRLS